MMLDPRFRSSYVVAMVLALGACSAAPDDALLPEDDASVDSASRFGRPGRDAGSPSRDASSPSRDAGVDAGPTRDAMMPDAGDRPGGGDSGGSGVVSCYLEGYPSTSCALPSHCCFSNYSSQHNGECTTSSCTWGTIDCDGPEDCATGQHCCAHAMFDPEYGLTGYKLGCQASACGAAPMNQELCHPTSSALNACSNSRSCVPTLGRNNDLPRSLYICQ